MIEKDMETLVNTFLIICTVFTLIGLVIILIGGILFDNDTCGKIGIYSFAVSIICIIGAVIAGGINSKKTAEIAEEEIIKVVETKKEPIIDTTIVIKNGITDTTFTYKFRK